MEDKPLLIGGKDANKAVEAITSEKSKEEELMQTIKDGNFEKIENVVTPRAFQKCESNSLEMAMKVNFKIRNLAKNMGPDKERFNQLANTVEEFTTTLLDPLRSDEDRRKQFGDHILDDVLEVAIANEQKKFFTHPVVHEEMNRKWYGRKFQQRKWKWWQRLLFDIWCLFDLVLSPILLPIFSLMKMKEEKRMNMGKNAPASIVIVPKSRKVRVGDQVVFTCEEKESGNPIESTTWYKDGVKLNQKRHMIEYMIESAQNSDKGRYTCEVKNGVGENDRFTVTLTVDPLYLIYLDYLETPYYKFLRDTLSYIILLALHFSLCLAPSTKTISGLEWTIFVFFAGRYLVERKQLRQQKTGYLRDCWNFLDFISLLVYLVIFLLRVGTTIMLGSVENNRALAIAGYMYGFNTLFLTLRIFGHVMEQSKFVGTIQIALFSILKEIQIVFGQFMAALLAFSITLTKIYMTEKSFLAKKTDGKDIACSESGTSCWWAMFTHLGWSLLGLSEEFDRLASADHVSETIARVCFAAFLIIGAILLVNMLIALLSHTYQRTEDNSFKEWSFQRAITIQTYDAYDPIPVPLNIIYNIISMLLWCVKRRGKKTSNGKGKNGTNVPLFFKYLEEKYFEKHTNLFPVTDAQKLDLVLKETERNRQMVSQILNTTFTLRRDYCGPEAWKVHPSIRIEGLLLTCEEIKSKQKRFPGARYRTAFSSVSPHFEVVILEIGKKGQLGIGVVNENYDNEDMPGWSPNSLGYHTSDGEIFYDDQDGKKTKGHVMARRGDLIRCAMVEGKSDDEVSFFFTLNGRMISTQDENATSFALKKDDELYPYIAMADGCSVLARM